MSEGKDGETRRPGDTERKTISRSLSRPADSESGVESFEFDVALAFNESDEEEAERVAKEIGELVLQDGTTAKVCLFTDVQFGASRIERGPRVLKSCRFVFVMMTNNTTEDDFLRFVKNEALAQTRLETRSEEHRVRVLHTEAKSDPRHLVGLKDAEPLAWHEPGMDRAKSKMVEVLSMNRNIKPDGQTSNGKSKEKKAMTPQTRKIRDDSNCVLRNWQRENNVTSLYCPTFATRISMETLKLKGSLLISGRSGDGKTATAHHILTTLTKNNPSFQPYIVHKPEDLDHVPLENSIIFIDNIFGASNFSSVLLEQWKVKFQTLEAYVAKGRMYFLATSPSHVLDSCSQQINSMPLLTQKVDMVDEYSLRSDEKAGMLTRYLKWKGLSMTDSQKEQAVNSKLSLGFPQCCKLYVPNSEAQKLGAEFFEKPYIFLNEQVSKFETSEIDTDRVLYQILLFCVFQKGHFLSESLNFSTVATSPASSSSDPPPAFDWLMLNDVCRVPTCCSEDRRLAAKNLFKMGFLRYMKQTSLYEFSHQSIYDAVCVSLGKKEYMKEVFSLSPASFLVNNTTVDDVSLDNVICIPEVHRPLLIARIVSELKQGNFKILEHDLFCHSESVDELFRETEFVDVLTNMFKDRQTVLKIWGHEILYFLSASNRYQQMVLEMIDMLETVPQDDVRLPRDELFYSSVEKIGRTCSPLPTSFNDVRKALIHQCFEGACKSGNLRIFLKLKKKIQPCDDCFHNALESHVDSSQIFQELLSLIPESSIDGTRLISDLLKWKKSESLDIVLKSDRLSLDSVRCAKSLLFKTACMSGSFEMFDKLKTVIGLPEDRNHELLFASIEGGDTRIVREFITEEDKDYVDERGRTILHLACEKVHSSNEELLDFLLAFGVNTSILDKMGRSALHVACKYKDLNVLEKLINHGVEVTVTNTEKTKLSPLHMAAQNEKGASMVDILLKRWPNYLKIVDFQDDNGLTPLHIAAQRPHGRQMIEKLFEVKADYSIRDKYGQTALHLASESNLLHNMQSLVDLGLDVNAVNNKNKTALHHVLSRQLRREQRKSHIESVHMLLHAGADVHVADEDGNTALHIAVESQAGIQVLKQLLEKFTGDVGLNKNGLSPLHLLFGEEICQKSMNLLLAKFPSLLETDTTDGRSVLHIALQQRSPYHIIDHLLKTNYVKAKYVKWQNLDVGSIFSHFTAEELTTFIAACTLYFPSSVKFAICQFVCKYPTFNDKHLKEICVILDVESMSNRSSLMFDALGSDDKLKYLIDIGADVNERDPNGASPLQIVLQTNFIIAFIKSMSKHMRLHFMLNLLQHVNVKLPQYTIFSKVILNSTSTVFNRMEFFTFVALANAEIDVKSTISLLLDRKSNVNAQDNKGLTPLHYSVCDEELLTQLISAGGDVNITTQDGWSCLHLACLVNNRTAVRFLIESGLSLFASDIHGVSPFHFALISEKDDDFILEMLKVCNKYNLDEHELTPTKSPFPGEKIEMMVDPSCLFTKDSEGHLPIFYAVSKGRLTVVKVLSLAMKQAKQEQNINSDVGERFVLMPDEDTCGPTTPTMKTLLDTYGNVDAQTLLHVACQFGAPPLLHFLVKEGFQVNSLDENKQTPLHVSTISNKNDNVDYLLAEGAEVECRDVDGKTPLMLSCMSGFLSYEVVSNLILHGALVTTRSNTQKTALHYLAGSEGLKFSKHHYICSDPSTVALKILTLLLKHGDDVNVKDKDGRTPLHLAAEANNEGFVSMLLDHGADIEETDGLGISPAEFAFLRSGSSFATAHLLDRGAKLDFLDESNLSKKSKLLSGSNSK